MGKVLLLPIPARWVLLIGAQQRSSNSEYNTVGLYYDQVFPHVGLATGEGCRGVSPTPRATGSPD